MWRIAVALLLVSSCGQQRAAALRFDAVPLGGGADGQQQQRPPVHDGELQAFLRTSIAWLQARADEGVAPELLRAYAEQLGLVLHSGCAHCVDYYEAAGLVGALGKSVAAVLAAPGADGTHLPAVRRAYVAAVWLLQRSRMFAWETTHLQGAALGTMFQLYMGHVQRARGRTVSLHHISKCGGTTMCQLAASNRCSNPHLSQEKNCVLNDRLDGPLWMVGHHVTRDGVVHVPAIGTLDAPPPNATAAPLSPRVRFANEPRMDMWLMYACPYAPNGRAYDCAARAADAHESGTTFLANERALTADPAGGRGEVCADFLNAVILREPVPHAISIMAEAKYRYVRQLAVKHGIRGWAPSAWNLTWWAELAPALVGNYATRTLLGRGSFCRSAANVSEAQLAQATDALMAFDLVMTLGRSADIDLVITTLLGWPARNFSSQPGARVREVSVDLATSGSLAVGDSKASHGSVAAARRALLWDDAADDADADAAGAADAVDVADAAEDDDNDADEDGRAGRSLLGQQRKNGKFKRQQQKNKNKKRHGGRQHGGKNRGKHGGHKQQHGRQRQQHHGAGKGRQHSDGHERQQSQHSHSHAEASSPAGVVVAAAAAAGAASDAAASTSPAPAAASPAPAAAPLSPSELERQAALNLVATTWLERQAELLGVRGADAVRAVTGQPLTEHTGQRSAHGAHLVKVVHVDASRRQVSEVWHAFPRHTFAFPEADVGRLEALTSLDARLHASAGLLLDLDAAWLQAMLASPHYRRRLQRVAATYTSCGFAGMMPLPQQARGGSGGGGASPLAAV